MTDAVQIALILGGSTALPATLAAILGFMNRAKIGTVETKVDGHMSAMTEEIAAQKKLILELTASSEHKAGQLQETQEARERPK